MAARKTKSERPEHSTVCTKPGCRQCQLLRAVEENLHPVDLPERPHWEYEPSEAPQ